MEEVSHNSRLYPNLQSTPIKLLQYPYESKYETIVPTFTIGGEDILKPPHSGFINPTENPIATTHTINNKLDQVYPNDLIQSSSSEVEVQVTHTCKNVVEPPRNSPRLLLAVLLTILSLCLLHQWKQDLSNTKIWKLHPKSPKIKDPKPRFQSFLPHLLEHQPSNSSLELPEGYLLVRIEEINSESERINHLTLSSSDLNKSFIAHSAVLSLLPEYSDLITYAPHSRGIITVGGGSYTRVLLVSILMLRRTNCTLPIEVFIPSPEDCSPYSCSTVLASLNAQCILLPTFQNANIARYQYKSLVLLFSSFENVLFLNADNFPIVDPKPWFDTIPYKETGMITWPDCWANTASPLYYTLSNQSIPSIQSQHASTETGSILISRSK
ncbi:hypothetical protein OCU04_008810 [Sclerotinia nivalis]|uniref:Uncharacterized protein n=1 Tax=Sclerotinia nivalis TaxID=352851 RepID=A0A9X0AG98_9HELO|nr:hypothetical protein OCU04_008810 [Sclerotinia nivalis]